MINLRNCNDKEKIINLLAECMYSDENRVKIEYERYMYDQTRSLFGIIENNKLIGIIGVIWLSVHEIELKHIAVSSSNRGTGLGKRLINEFIVTNRIRRVILETDKNAVTFYKKIGFSITSLGEKYPGVERFKCIRDCY